MATIEASTLGEAARMDRAGMERLSPDEARARAQSFGYRLELEGSYVNGSNEIPYRARMVTYRHIESGKNYAHVDAPRETLPRLMDMRLNCYVLHRGDIWEL